MSWDESVEMMGSFPTYWAVLRSVEDRVEVWMSPYMQLPPSEEEIQALEEDGSERQGMITYLMRPLKFYSDVELGVAARQMADLALEDFVWASLTNRIFRAMKEQREREGGYVSTPYDQEADEA